MKQETTTINVIDLPSVLLVKVPNVSYGFEVVDNNSVKEFEWHFGMYGFDYIPLPPGNYDTPLTYANAPDELRAVVWVELIEADIKEISGNWILIPKAGAIKQTPPMPEEFQDPQYFIDIIEKKKK